MTSQMKICKKNHPIRLIINYKSPPACKVANTFKEIRLVKHSSKVSSSNICIYEFQKKISFRFLGENLN